ncbi:hypothetical protein [Escherichia coli]|uniref:Uncharacterized protein n=1 Tax=Escherichia coli TaxID=562 RepID=A0A4D2QPK8_ECOLX|nr:hypothetical protein [Escherichia coli]EAB4767262.1 hypothetical protein [Salmonella enterica]EDW4977787.1 hypothetical protein [Salmonella enterica subsp. enterica serovar Thompson]EHM2532706.1 hypothetical protein [Salmonella enterica subsp. enterica serovar Newport]EKF4273933.1 hypothetical protein [Escherichia coli O45]EBE1150650.1 hypothetical protein [Salmonella enterica]
MMRKALKMVLITTAIISPIAQAQWLTQTEDDLFSDGKKAAMIGETSSDNSAIIFNCTKNTLTAAYVEMDKTHESTAKMPMELVMKVDGNNALKFNATLSRRNVQALEIATNDAEQLKILLKQLKEAKSQVLVGAQTEDGGSKFSLSANVSGSTSAVNKFVAACEIKL